jgi:uncharacterized phiE125 gp8 family phage protein
VLTYPITRPVQSAEPTFEPVTLDEAKKQCEVAGAVGYHDEQLRQLIKAARETVEHDTGLSLCTRTFSKKLTEWPCREYFEIHLRPVTSITSIVYLDTSGTSTTWGSSNYVLETSTVVPIVRLAYGQDWPSIRGDINGITVTMVAGYATQLAIPQMAKQAVLLALHSDWLASTEQDMTRQQEAYSRLIGRLERSTYP